MRCGTNLNNIVIQNVALLASIIGNYALCTADIECYISTYFIDDHEKY